MFIFDCSSTLYFDILGKGMGMDINFELKQPTINTIHMDLKVEMTILTE